jgi:hypothetical protein
MVVKVAASKGHSYETTNYQHLVKVVFPVDLPGLHHITLAEQE